MTSSSADPNREYSPLPLLPPRPDGTRRRILVVEDHPSDQRLAAKILQHACAEVVLECNGDAALKLIERMATDGERFDLILMDLHLPAVNGIDATVELRRQSNMIPIVAVTANTAPHIASAWKAAGCNAFVKKPYDAEQLLLLVAQLCEQADGLEGDSLQAN